MLSRPVPWTCTSRGTGAGLSEAVSTPCCPSLQNTRFWLAVSKPT